MINKSEIIGLIPAAGKALRLGPIPTSKELITVGFETINGNRYPKTVSSYLLDQMSDAGISDFHIVLRKGKWDIPNYYGGGEQFNMNICYQIADHSYCVPFTINQAYPFIKNKTVAFGFPDILIKPRKVFSQLIEKLNANLKTDFIIGLFPSYDALKEDHLDNTANKVKNNYITNKKALLNSYTWIIAVWQPSFTKFLHQYLDKLVKKYSSEELMENECQLSDILNMAIVEGYNADFVFFEKGDHIDIGTPERLEKAVHFIKSTL